MKDKNKNKNAKNRIANVTSEKRRNDTRAKVNNGCFVYCQIPTIAELAKSLNIETSQIIKYLFLNKRKMVTINQTLDEETLGEVCLEFGYDFRKEEIVAEEDFENLNLVDDPKDLVERPPVVTIMGHVDHGKTTLIDAIRNSHLVESEVGGISQAIGAYQKEYHGKKITFIDTPGHEAFAEMRSRGAKVTDIIILVVAADDGVMPQTKEAIDHARAANVPILVAINKIDKPGANIDKVKNELMALNVVPEEYGGDTIFLNIAAKKGQGIDELLENILVMAEMLELKANPNRYAMGTVLEAKLDKGEGPKATLLVQNGTLNASDYVVVGACYGKVRRMTNEFKKILKVATPSTPVSIIGLSEVPKAGDLFMAFPSEKQARDIAYKRHLKMNEDKQVSKAISLDDLYERIHEGEMKEVNVIIKADTNGSAEAIKSSLEKLSNDEVKVKIIRATAGAITESDVLLASASNAIIYGFNVRPDNLVKTKANEEKVDIRLHNIIYALIEEMEAALKGMKKAKLEEVVIGRAEIRHLFRASKVGTIAGAYVTDGSIRRDANMRLIRDGIVIYDGKFGSLKRFKDDAKEVKSGFECGFTIENYNDLKEGDEVEAYVIKEMKED